MDQIDKAAETDQPALVETLAQAFQTDPALSWILPDTAHRARALRSLFRTLVPADMRAGIALRSADDEAAALWRAPGQAHGGTLEFLRTVVPLIASDAWHRGAWKTREKPRWAKLFQKIAK